MAMNDHTDYPAGRDLDGVSFRIERNGALYMFFGERKLPRGKQSELLRLAKERAERYRSRVFEPYLRKASEEDRYWTRIL